MWLLSKSKLDPSANRSETLYFSNYISQNHKEKSLSSSDLLAPTCRSKYKKNPSKTESTQNCKPLQKSQRKIHIKTLIFKRGSKARIDGLGLGSSWEFYGVGQPVGWWHWASVGWWRWGSSRASGSETERREFRGKSLTELRVHEFESWSKVIGREWEQQVEIEKKKNKKIERSIILICVGIKKIF